MPQHLRVVGYFFIVLDAAWRSLCLVFGWLCVAFKQCWLFLGALGCFGVNIITSPEYCLNIVFFDVCVKFGKRAVSFPRRWVALFQRKGLAFFQICVEKRRRLKKMQKKNVAKIAIVAGLLFMLTYALAAELGLEVGFVGSSTADVSGSYNMKIKSVVDRTPAKLLTVSAVELKVDRPLTAGTEIYINVLDDSNVVIGSGQITLTNDVAKNGKITVTLTPVSGAIVDPAAVASYQASIVTPVSDFP